MKRFLRSILLPGLAVASIAAGFLAEPEARRATWTVLLMLVGAPVLLRSLLDVLRLRLATDVVAAIAIGGAILLGQPLAGLIVVVMQTGGEALERYAEGRASAAVRALEDAAPRTAHRVKGDVIQDIAVEAIDVGDLLLVKPGDVVPCDGTVVDGHSLVDASRLTGESAPVAASVATRLLSGMINGNGSLHMRATARAGASQYARIVELVRSAESSKAPLQRLADRYAAWFTPFALVVSGIAWALTGDPLRALAVMVVATPCPLILATPIAIIGGINRAARRQVIVRSASALERLSEARIAVLDKTGTLTHGVPEVADVHPLQGADRRDVLRLAGAVEQHAGHLLARSLRDHAQAIVGDLPAATQVVEDPGRGVEGVVEGHRVIVGATRYVADRLQLSNAQVQTIAGDVLDASRRAGNGAAVLQALVAVDAHLAGVVTWADQIRPSTLHLLKRLPELGIQRTVLLSGDNNANVAAVASSLGITEARGELMPEDKVAHVARLAESEGHVMMVGDGINDAPALSRADVGVALAGHGGGIAAESADVVILVDDPARVADAVSIARDTMAIARQSISVGLGLSAVAMLVAAWGYLPPVAGALLQEVIDVAVILNALRARG